MKNTTLIKKLFKKYISLKVDEITKIGGMTNINYLVNGTGKFYVLRIPPQNSNNIIDRNKEAHIENIIKNKSISPKCIYFDIDSGVKITEFIEAKTLNFTNIQNNFSLIAYKLKELHNSKLDFKYYFNPFDEMEKYIKIAKKSSDILDEFDLGLQLFYKAWDEIIKINKKFLRKELVFLPTHGDLVPENILVSDNNIILIDWEYAGLNDPCWDLASFILECSLDKTLENDFLSLYEASELQRLKIEFYKDLVDILWAIWGVAKSDKNNDYIIYAKNRLNSALQRNNL